MTFTIRTTTTDCCALQVGEHTPLDSNIRSTLHVLPAFAANAMRVLDSRYVAPLLRHCAFSATGGGRKTMPNFAVFDRQNL